MKLNRVARFDATRWQALGDLIFFDRFKADR